MRLGKLNKRKTYHIIAREESYNRVYSSSCGRIFLKGTDEIIEVEKIFDFMKDNAVCEKCANIRLYAGD